MTKALPATTSATLVILPQREPNLHPITRS